MASSINLQAPPPPRTRPTVPTSTTAFNLPSSPSNTSTSNDDEADPDAPLPFPTALARRDFLVPDFNAASYLSSLFPSTAVDNPEASTLAQRHQTLEDLRAELRERSSAISAELLELVNSNYTSFLGLGDELKGGEERVEDVRVALLGFRRQVDEIRGRVRGRKEDVRSVSGLLRDVRGELETGRRMLELDERLEVLQGNLEAGSADDEGSLSDDTEEEDGEVAFKESSLARLMALTCEYIAIEKVADAVGRDLPYVKKMEERITRCRNTLLLDLGTSMKEARRAGASGHDRVLKFLAIYRAMDAHAEGVKMLKER